MKVIDQYIDERCALYHGDCAEVLKEMPDNSAGYSIFSPPFKSLYTYTNSPRDMGNNTNSGMFATHFGFLIPELFRVIQAGRLVSIHCINLPTSKERDGFIGLTDFRGELIREFVKHGFIFHSEVCIWKDPLVAMQRTKALGLLHKQIVKDSSMCRQGIPDYLVTLRKPGKNEEPISHKPAGFESFIGEGEPTAAKTDNPKTNKYSHLVWQKYASPVWMDINPSDTLQYRSARENDDERHICPLQLEVIRRGIELWSNPGDTVLSPFGGTGSEPYTAIEMERRAIAVELKNSYYKQMVANCKNAKTKSSDGLGGVLFE